MGIAIPQLAPASEDRVSGALVVDGSLKFNSDSGNHLVRNVPLGNQRVFTFSAWVKFSVKTDTADHQYIFATDYNVASGSHVVERGFAFYYNRTNKQLYAYDYGASDAAGNSGSSVPWSPGNTTAVFRDPSAWYHIVLSVDTTSASERVKLYVNTQLHSFSTSPDQNSYLSINQARNHYVGAHDIASTLQRYFDGKITNTYFIEGQALGPSYFGFTDPLTGTWRPKKFRAQGTTVNDGTTWSNSVSGTEDSGWSKTQSFDGILSSSSRASNGNSLTWTPSTPIPIKHSLRIYGRKRGNGNAVLTVNGTSYVSLLTEGSETYITIPESNITTVVWSNVNGNSDSVDIGGFEVDGVLMIDNTTQNLDFGTNGFYLPMDGNSPIGEDKSGNGNNWKPVNFGGSVALDNPQVSGARPILNTDGGGNVARPGVFGSEAGAFYATTSASNSGGKYYFSHDATAQPTFSFIRGATYTFDWSASSGHPLRFATAADAAGSTEYTDGTDVTGNVTTITVPHNAPDTLYYYCNVHNGMGNSISVTTDETKADPYAWKCTLAIPFVNNTKDYSGDINCTVSSITTSSDNLTFSTPGDMFYGSPAKLLGNGSSNSRVLIASGAFAFGTGDFTIEFWAHFTATGDQGNRNSRILTAQSESGEFVQILSASSTAKMQFDDNHIPNIEILNKTRHYVYQRTGTTCQLIVDGVLYDSDTQSRNFADVAYQIGRYDASNGGASLYMADFRVYTGVQKYPNSGLSIGDPVFTPASTSPDILPDTPSGVSGSSKLAKVTDGAVSFDASDYLSTGASSDFNLLDDGTFTIEFFFYANSLSGGYADYVGVFDGSSTGLLIYEQGGLFDAYINGAQRVTTTHPGANKWHHAALTRDGTTLRLFVDGILKSTSTASLGSDYSGALQIGGANGRSGLNGFISNVRVIKGTALYTTDFTPPFRTLTAVTNTKLLCCQSNTSAGGYAVVPTSGINDGTIWSDGTDPALDNFDGIRAIFDGSLTTRGGDTNTEYLTYVNNASISASTGIRIYYNGIGSGQRYIRINGTTELDDGSGTLTPGWSSVSSFNGTINKIEIKTANTGSFGVSAIEIDGTILVDPLAANGNVAATTFNPFNTDINTVRGQETGYATLNAVKINSSSSIVLSDGNLRVDITGNYYNALSNLGMSSGNFYCEISPVRGYSYFGIATNDVVNNTWGGDQSGNVAWVLHTNGSIYHNNATTNGTGFPTPGTSGGYTLGLLFDANRKTMRYVDNGAISKIYNMANTVDGDSFYYFIGGDAGSYEIDVNFGQKPFKFPPPAGFQPLNAASVRPETVIARPDQFVSATLYTGDQTVRTISTGNAPDLVWIKDRTQDGHNHNLIDTVRGAPKILQSDSVSDDITDSTDGLTSFTSNGFVLGPNLLGNQSYELNKTGNDYVAWCWKAGGKDGSNAFNIDDVGYASAADVNMSVGALDSSLYNTSQIWSSTYAGSAIDGSYPITQAFDGNRATTARTSATETVMSVALTNITVVDKIEVCGETGYITPNVSVTIGGVTYNIGGDPNTAISGTSGTTSKTITGVSGALTNVTVGKISGGRTYLSQIIVDGKILVNSNITPPNLPSIAATGCSVGTKQGFSIVKYTGEGAARTLNHGMNKVPRFMLVKRTDADASWAVYHAEGGNTKVYELNTGGTGSTSSTVWNSTTPTSSVFSIGDYADSGGDGSDYIAYLWADVPGLQKFGKWTNNNSNSGTFTELGFRPAILLLKDIDGGEQWYIIDSKRQTFNIVAPSSDGASAVRTLQPSSSNNETTADNSHTNATVDFLSNGFKIYTTNPAGGEISYGTRNYIYAAWAEAPLSNLYGAQSNAR